MAPLKLIIDTDPGIDDSMAILAAFHSPEVEIIGLTTIFGNVPVAQGALTSLKGVAKERIADFVHGSDGFGNTDPEFSQEEPLPISAAQFIVECAAKWPGEVVVLALGPLTNVALAIHLNPDLPQLLHKVVVLGGAFFVNGNVNPAAEANIFGDPDAANVVFAKAPNCWVVGLDVTHQCQLSRRQLDGLQGVGRHGSFLSAISQFYLSYHKHVGLSSYGMDAVFVHDAAALSAVLRPELFQWHAGAVLVDTEGAFRGHTLVDEGKKEWVGMNEWQTRPKIKVALGVDAKALTDLVLQRMSQ
ncbi:hypothetical protein APUTEX25_005166 [Auxenochlorella protothecoides]|uniref:Inosine/uridine-preferring nucleoside hydrolase domain-containing protein n=1 Tax=Auxenochlorella protothecoides TaxID=3075 RepID=A0A3M7KS43_AUXPR|nr:hypothetical protein APUTEX25_005166 [Auxenochlorella protothecoides]|eukprot:RMZ53177.1 hypothetical protein APUTEX25_005166 [Auxenochlorella protothecoides]